ncbi:hypothetical protein KPH14_007135 [Odynerus spinipes]|uniref:Uncharacterized protein n=1 Tax=Odynerus spinipes TaxID=1348599 RepID=A0AAD9VRY4_9HYME|nr:hypothetical protein KPH14_007135 [Odynerus spinipes]
MRLARTFPKLSAIPLSAQMEGRRAANGRRQTFLMNGSASSTVLVEGAEGLAVPKQQQQQQQQEQQQQQQSSSSGYRVSSKT